MKIVATLDCLFQLQEKKSVHLLCLNFSNFSLHSWLVTTLMVPSISWADFGPRNFTAPQPATVTEAASNCREHRPHHHNHHHHHYYHHPHLVLTQPRRYGGQTCRRDGLGEGDRLLDGGNEDVSRCHPMSRDVTRCHAMSCDAWSVMMAMSLL